VTNNFVKIGDQFKAESWNGAMMNATLMSPTIVLSLPSDLLNGIFNDSEQLVGPCLVTLILSDTEFSTDKTRIQLSSGKTSGTATLRVYPNFEPFKKWISISNLNNVPFDIKKNFGQTVVATNATNDLTNYGLGLEYVDFVFKLSSGYNVLTNINLKVKGGV
jgi:hypothetical protein